MYFLVKISKTSKSVSPPLLFHHLDKAEELKNLVHFIVFKRKGDGIENISQRWDYEITEMDYVDISSTEIRAGNNKLNNIVEGYIKENGLYKI